jgi:hypothetical protein
MIRSGKAHAFVGIKQIADAKRHAQGGDETSIHDMRVRDF